METRRAASTGLKLPATVLALLFAAPGCGHVDIWSRDEHGGLLQTRGNEERAREDAQRAMAEHCGPGRYRVVPLEAGDVPQGAASGVEVQVGPGGPQVREVSAEEVKAKSYIRYRCATPTPPPEPTPA